MADLASAYGAERFFLPCVGRFAALEAMVEKGIPVEKIWASDLSLYSSIIGYLADPDKSIHALGVPIEGDQVLERMVDGTDDPLGFAAGLLLALQYLKIDEKSLYASNIKREIWRNHIGQRDHILEKLKRLLAKIEGIHYDQVDVWDVADSFLNAGPDSFFYTNLPGYKRGYTKMFGCAEARMGHTSLAAKEFDPKTINGFLTFLQPAEGLATAYSPHGLERVPEEWIPVMAVYKNARQTTYVVANRETEDRYAYQKIRRGNPVILEIYDDQEITKDSVISMMPVDEATALYYRDLFVHRLGSTSAEYYFLVLIDGRVVSVNGFNDQAINHGKSKYVSEVFQISKSSQRYARLAKLLMRCTTSGSFKNLLLRTRRSAQFRDIKGIRTTSITKHREGKIDRGVMKRVSVEAHPSGWKLIYQADFRDDTFTDNLHYWLERWGHKSRPGWTVPDDGKGVLV